MKNDKKYQWDGLSSTRIENTRSETEEEPERQEKEFDQDRGTKKLSNLWAKEEETNVEEILKLIVLSSKKI